MKQFTPLCRSILLLLLLLSGNLLQAQVIYITPNGAGTQTGASWANAAPGSQLQTKINGAASGSQLWVAAGTYRPNTYPAGYSGTDTRNYTFFLKNGVAIYGGFAGTESLLSQRNVKTNVTILSGDMGTAGDSTDNSYHVLVIAGSASNADSVVVDGFTVTGGNANGTANISYGNTSVAQSNGGGAYIINNANSSKIALRNLIVSNNTAGYVGGGFEINNSSPLITNCVFSNNSSYGGSGGGGILNEFSASPIITNCTFYKNITTGSASGIIATNAGNGSGGGVSNKDNSSPRIVNCTFIQNSAAGGNSYAGFSTAGSGLGGGLYASDNCSPQITNCTFSGNATYAGSNSGYGGSNGNSYGGGLYTGTTAVVSNCIIYNNAANNNEGVYGATSVSYSLVQGGYSGTGNINFNPRFVSTCDPDGADNVFGTADDGLRLATGSAASNAGSNAAIPAGITTDITGAARIQNTTVDMGAYEGSTPLVVKFYVDSSRAVSGDGTSWASAFKELRDALAVSLCTSVVDSILVAKGTYKPTSTNNREAAFAILNNGLKLYGGYPNGGGTRNPAANPTILSGDIGVANTTTDNSYHVLVIAGSASNADSVVVDGFTVTGGNANGTASISYGNTSVAQSNGGGAYIINNANSSKIALRNLIVSNNTAGYVGGGFEINNSSPLITNCVFSNNSSYGGSGGGGILNEFSASPIITNCTFYKNITTGSASGIIATNAGNGSGGGVSNKDNSSPRIVNCTFIQNSAAGGNSYAGFSTAGSGLGGGLYASDNCSPQITNCTFSGNATYAGSNSGYGGSNGNSYGGGLYTGTTAVVSNCIIYNNAANNNEGVYGATSVSYSLVQGGYSGTGNLDTDPQFINSADADGNDNIPGTGDDGLRLQVGSPAINRGRNDSLPAGIITDIAGAARIQNGTVDMGAYEGSNCSIFTTVYVDSSVASSGNGSSWITAFKELRDALNLAAQCSNISSINVAKGTYKPANTRDSAFTILRGGLKMYGGYPTGGGTRNVTANPTILSGDIGAAGNNTDNSYHVLVIAGLASGADSLVLDGFTITGGNANGTTSINYGSTSVYPGNGGSAYIINNANGKKIALRNLTVSSNRADYVAGGFEINNSSPFIVNCIFNNNSSGNNGGGMFNEVSASPSIVNCLFVSNSSNSNGGGLSNLSSSPSITNCTFYANSSSNGGGAIYNSSSSPLLNSCIIWGNTGSNPGIYGSGGTVKYSNVQGLSGGTGNLNTNPFFANPSDADGTDNIWGTSDDGLKLLAGSLAINTGSNADVPSGITTDITGSARILNGTVDMGAYETILCPPSHKLYVNGGQATSGNGSSWATAIKELREALQMAQYCGNVDSILVAAGTYKPTDNTDQDSAFAILRGGIKIYGGYNAATGARNISANPTSLSANIGATSSGNDNSYHVLIIAGLVSSADSVIVDGFTIRDGFSPTATGSKTYNGIAIPRTDGAGICLQANNGAGRKITIRNCSILANGGHTNGGISNNASSPAIISCFFSGNYGYRAGGGGIGSYNASSPLIINCAFTNNQGINGGGIFNAVSSSPFITNCTLTANETGISNDGSSPVITNCIVWGNSASIVNTNGSSPAITYSIVQGTSVYPGTGNLNLDPMFTGGSLQLLPGSPAINAGSNAAVPAFVTTDINGAARIQNGVVDMGAYEPGFTCPASHKLYVNSSVAASGDGTSWATAYKQLQEAMVNLQFCSNVDSILVAAGTYKPSLNNLDSSFAISRGGLKMIGGYNAATGVRNIAANPTVLTGELSSPGSRVYHVVVIAGLTNTADSVVLDGFTITRGLAVGTGSYPYFGTDVPRNAGGGVALYANNGAGGKIAIRNCTITGNIAQTQGGGLCNQASSPTIVNCLFTFNTGSNGTAMYNSGAAQPAIVNCVFNQNTSGNGAIYNLSCAPVITNCTFSTSLYSVYNNNASPLITNSILWNNRSSAGFPIPGIYNEGSSAPVITNSIVQGGDNGAGGLNTDPLFVNKDDVDGADNLFGTADDGLNLQTSSPAINAGSNAAAATILTDITGSRRIENSIVDIGAYEKFACPVSPVLYVDNSANGNGSSWANALSGLSEALNIAAKCSSITTIYVAKGTYKPTTDTNRDSAFTILRGGLKIYGGYLTGGGNRNTAANPTILSGDIGAANNISDNSYHVMVIAGLTNSADSVVIDGFTTTSANANGSGTVKNYNGAPVLNNEGGGIYLHSNNGAGDKIAVRNCIFSNNSATDWGAGIYNQLSSPAITNCTFTANTARNAAGIFNYNFSSPSITNCVFTGNIALQDGGAIHNRLSSSPAITNCTLFSNGASAAGAGIYNNGSSPFITNSIIWGNTGNYPGIYTDNSSPTVTYSDVQGGYTGAGNISIDPLFVNSADADGADNIFGTSDDGLRLQSCSPAINSGINTVPNIPATDITSQTRIFNSVTDMGAYEYQAVADGSSLAVNGDNGNYNIRSGTNALLVPGCRVMAHLLPNGTNPVNGSLTAKIWIDNTQPVFNGKTYIKRHYEFTPAANAATATARITLYTTQQELNAFNSSPYNGISLPTGPNDFNGIANLRIVKFNGQSSNGTGLPATYGQAGVEIDPDDNNIVWNNSLTRWEISFNVTGFSGFFITNNSGILPLTLVQFSGKAVNNSDALLNWKTANEVNVSHFELQRSGDSRSFTAIATIQAKGNSQSETDYSYTDKGLQPGVFYYRLLMTDKDGKATYSPVIAVQFKTSSLLTLYPVPAKDVIWLGGNVANQAGKTALLMDMQGRILQQISITQWPQRIDVSALASGTYIIKVEGSQSLSFIK